MNKTIISIIGIVVLIGVGLLLISKKSVVVPVNNTGVKNVSIKIGSDTFNLINGKAETELVPGSVTKNTLLIFGEPVIGDLDGDGDSDAALLVANDPGGSGTFYYAVLAINNGGMYKATNAMFLGDRIAPQTVEIHDGRAVYNYADRKAGESFAVQPSVGKSVWVYYDVKNNEIGEWIKDFEGEANPAVMNLGMKKWTWIKTLMNDGKVTTPKKPNAFTLKFGGDGKLSVTTDCNSVGGTYKESGKNITFTNLYSTLMYCDGSQEQEFTKALGEVGSYMFTSKGELILMLKMDSGTMTFK